MTAPLSSQQYLIALDFDGVLCDSADETATTGWNAAAALWPERFSGPPTAAYLAAFRQVRPAIETGYESLLIARLLQDGVTPADLITDYAVLTAELAARYGLTRPVLIRHFGERRDLAIASDLPAWLALHRFYPGTIAAANAWQAAGHQVVVITTKETRFALALARMAGLSLPDDAIFGLEAGAKGPILRRLLADAVAPVQRVVFVEDRLPTLLAIATDPALQRVSLRLADWGYLRAGELAAIATEPRIRPLALADFPALATQDA